MESIRKRGISIMLTAALVISLFASGFGSLVASATEVGNGSSLANVTESYVDAANGKKISQDTSYSVTHEQKSPQEIANYTYVDYTESVERVFSHKDLNYIYGYPDRTVRPDRFMSRGEAAAVFFRLYDGVYPNMQYRMSNTTFSDLSTSAWFYKEVETLYNIGVIQDEDGSHKFRGNESITRAEFATWAARWANLPYSTGMNFSDVPVGYWAYGDINAASAAGWIDGYPDGTFRPDNFIQRSEVTKLVNGVVNRSITVEELNKLGVRNPYTDLSTNHWAYAQIMEATVQHNGADWHGTNYHDGKFNVIIETFVDGEGKEIAQSITSNGKAESPTRQIGGYDYIGYIRHITYVYNKGDAAPTITKTANVKESYVGGEIEYTVTLGNKSDAKAAWKNVVMTDKIPDGVKLVDGSVYVDKQAKEYKLEDNTLSLNVGDIEAGKQVVVTFKVSVQEGAQGKTIKNTVTAKGDNGIVKDETYTATDEGVYINQGIVKPSVEKKANVSKATVGDRISYTITASNSADATYKITDAVITDTIPEELTFRDGSVQVNGISAQYSFDEKTHVLNVKVGDIEPGKFTTVTFAADVNSAAYDKTIYNTSILTGSNSAEVKDTDDGIIVADGKTRPTLEKKASVSAAKVGDSITYTLIAGNTDEAAVAIKDAVVTDTLPKGLDFQYGSVQVDGKNISGTSYDDGTRVLTVPVGDIKPGKSVEITFVAKVNDDAYGSVIKNVAILKGDNAPDTKDEDDGVNVGDGTAKPYIEKTANVKKASVGDQIQYTLKVGNGETATVSLVNPVITDVLPKGLEFVHGSVYVDGKSYQDVYYDAADRTLTINLKDIERNTEVEVKFSATVTEDAYNSTIQNLATLTSDNGDRQQDQDDGVVIPDGRAQLTISKTADNRNPEVGEHVTYTIKVGNVAGASVPARGVEIRDQIPKGLTFAGIVQVDGFSTSYSYEDGTLVIPVGDIAAGYERTVKVEFVVNEDAYGQTITNVAVASADNADDKTATDAGLNVPEGKPDGYAASKTVSKNNAKVGDTLTYTFRLQNGAGATAAWENATITDVLPEGLTYKGNVKMNGATTTNYTWDEESRTLTLTAPSIAIGDAVTFSFDAVVDEGMQGKYIVNTAVVDGPGDQPDTDISDPGVMVDPGNAVPSAVKSADKDEAEVGDTILYTIEVSNNKSATAAWKDVVLTDTLPAGVRLLNSVTANGEPVAFAVNGKTLTARLGNIDIGETLTVRYEVLVLEEAAGTTLRNTAVLAGDNGDSSTSEDVKVPDDNTGLLPNEQIDVKKDVDKTLATVGPGTSPEDRQVTYTVTLKNDSASKETWENVIFTDVIDTKYATLISDSIYKNGVRVDSPNWVFENQKLTMEIGDIPYGQEVIVKFTIEFKTDAGDKTYINTATGTGTINGEKKWDYGDAPAVQVKPSQVISQVHYAIFHGVGDEHGNPTGTWNPGRNVYLNEIAIAAYRIMTNDGQLAIQGSGEGYVSDYVSDHYDIAVSYLVQAGVLNSDEFDPTKSGLIEGEDYVAMGDEEDPTYMIYATRDQIGRVFKSLFGDDYGVTGGGFMSRLDLAKMFCQIQGRDTDPNYKEAQAAGLIVETFTDTDEGVVIETSNTHDYVKDSYGNETWVLNNALSK